MQLSFFLLTDHRVKFDLDCGTDELITSFGLLEKVFLNSFVNSRRFLDLTLRQTNEYFHLNHPPLLCQETMIFRAPRYHQ